MSVAFSRDDLGRFRKGALVMYKSGEEGNLLPIYGAVVKGLACIFYQGPSREIAVRPISDLERVSVEGGDVSCLDFASDTVFRSAS